MKQILINLGPTGLIVALIVFCCDLPANGQKKEKSIDKSQLLDAKMLALTSTPAPGRDPFGLKAEVVLPSSSKQKESSQPTTTVTAVKNAVAEKSSQVAQVDLAAMVRGLSLEATCASESGGTALINGKFYSRGDAVNGKELVALVLERVDEDRVLLRRGGETAELKFRGTDTKIARSKPARSSTRVKTVRPVAPRVRD